MHTPSAPHARSAGKRLATLLATLDQSDAVKDLRSRVWKPKYTTDDHNIVDSFYTPALECAVRYDRLTGYFSASALTLAIRGIEGLIRNSGHLRLIVGCTLGEAEIAAITRGEALRDVVNRHMQQRPLHPPDEISRDALELLAWMIEHGFLEAKVAVPCDSHRRPLNAEGIFHAKTGIIEDAAGDRIAFSGSLNETSAGWKNNWETLSVFTSWGGSPAHVDYEVSDFAKLWADKAERALTLEIPAAVRADILRFKASSDLPARLAQLPAVEVTTKPIDDRASLDGPKALPDSDLRKEVWGYVRRAPTLSDGGALVGEATCAVEPWPHQIHAFERLYASDAPRLLIADEVGLGKTIQAGMLLRQLWLTGRAKRVLILAPAAVMRQWQLELREKFNLNWPVYDDGQLTWARTPAHSANRSVAVTRDQWHRQNAIIASSHLMRRRDRENELCEDAEPWDVVILDEAHHARRKGAGSGAEEGPNALLRLMRRLEKRTTALILLTATPMQVHPVEVWDLLALLGLPAAWSASAFQQFFEVVGKASPSHEEFDRLAAMFRATEARYGLTANERAERIGAIPRLRAKRILGALRSDASTPRKQLDSDDRATAIKIMRTVTPVSHLVSRHTRELLRSYFKSGKMSVRIADRDVRDQFITLTRAERNVYEAVESYIATTYNQAAPEAKNAVGFVMTVYRRRLASSFRALRATLERRLALSQGVPLRNSTGLSNADDASDDETVDDIMDGDDAARLETQVLQREEQQDIGRLLDSLLRLAPDTKAKTLHEVFAQLQNDGYQQAMVFTQFTDTMDYLRAYLVSVGLTSILCFSGRGGEALGNDGRWRPISRDEVKRRFRAGQSELLLCTDAAAEGLNFQFCGALVNYDMPWNPMRVEQRIGRIDRLGQRFASVRIVNLHYADTVEADVYNALRKRIGLFERVVGKLQPILSQLPSTISSSVLRKGQSTEEARADVTADVLNSVNALSRDSSAIDLDEMTSDALDMSPRAAPALTLEMLDGILRQPRMLPPAVVVQALGHREYSYLAPGMHAAMRVTTDPELFEQHSDSLELWSPGSPLFPNVDDLAGPEVQPAFRSASNDVV